MNAQLYMGRALCVAIISAASFCVFAACSEDSSNGPQLGDAELQQVLLEVSYEPDVESYTGLTKSGEELWDLFSTNFETLLQGSDLTVSSPESLTDMSLTEDFSDEDFTSSRILGIDEAYRKTKSSQSVLAFHAIFKPLVESSGLSEAGRRFGEQATLIHEVGHALGLVNSELTMPSHHQDSEHGAHCDEEECVMFWANEGPSELIGFVQNDLASGKTLLFDANCISDVRGSRRK